jgi:hypothetical protein
MTHPTATWKVTVPSPSEDEAASPAVVWRNSEAECEAWIGSRIGVEPAQACLDYGWAGPLAPVPLPLSVVDRLRPPGEGRVVERFADRHEAESWMRIQRGIEALAPTPGDYELVGPEALAAVLALPALRVRRGGAVREIPPAPGEGRPDLRGLERATVARRIPTAIGELEVRAYADGHLRVSAGRLFDQDVSAPPARLPDGGTIAFEAIARLDGERLSSRGLRYEIRDAAEEAVDDAATVRAGVNILRGAVRESVNGLLDTYPRDRDESLERLLMANLARFGEERRSIAARLANLDRVEASATGRLAEVRAKLAEDAEPAFSPGP